MGQHANGSALPRRSTASTDSNPGRTAKQDSHGLSSREYPAFPRAVSGANAPKIPKAVMNTVKGVTPLRESVAPTAPVSVPVPVQQQQQAARRSIDKMPCSCGTKDCELVCGTAILSPFLFREKLSLRALNFVLNLKDTETMEKLLGPDFDAIKYLTEELSKVPVKEEEKMLFEHGQTHATYFNKKLVPFIKRFCELHLGVDDEIVDFQNRIKELKKANKEFDAQCNENKKQMDKLAEENKKLTNANKEYESKCKDRMDAQANEILELTKQLTDLQGKATQSQQAATDLEQRLKEAQNMLTQTW